MLNQILSMGGYGIYVWPAYGLTLTVFALNLWYALREKKLIKNALRMAKQEVSSES